MSIKNTLKKLIKESIDIIFPNYNNEIELTYYNDNKDIYYISNIIVELDKKLYITDKEIFNRIKEKLNNQKIIKDIELLPDNNIKIFLKEEYLIEKLDKIINLDKDYGKNNLGNNQKINIELSILDKDIDINKHINTIINIDNKSRIMNYCGYEIEKEIYINNDKDNNKIKELTDNYRVYIDKYTNNKEIEDNYQIEDLLNKIRYYNICSIENNSILLNTKEKEVLIDDYGNYTDYFKYLTHIYENYNNYDRLIIINNIEIKEALNLLNLDLDKIEIYNLEEKEIQEDSINYIRYNSIINETDDKNLIKITKFNSKIDKIIRNIENKKEDYNNINNNIIYNIINKLTDFEDIIVESYKKDNLKIIITYLVELISLINILIERKSFFNPNIIKMFKSSKIVINNSLNIIGLIPIDEI